jgi:hypothetical protein
MISLRSLDMRRTSTFDCIAVVFPLAISRKAPRSLPSMTAVRSGFNSTGFVVPFS